MKQISGYVVAYVRSLNPFAFLGCTLFTAAAIFCNYYFGVNAYINTLADTQQFLAWFSLFLFVFLFGYYCQTAGTPSKLFQNPIFLLLSGLAAAVFAWKMTARYHFSFTNNSVENAYWNHVVYWPLKLAVVVFVLFGIWKSFHRNIPFYGASVKRFDVKPYLFLLLLMLPLLVLASTQPDFLAVYPKLKNIHFLQGGGTWLHTLIYELSYGSDFVTIELFFRGFLVLGFSKWAGEKAVLPMAMFYCTIHFGKPLGECISSYFGGLILGAVTLKTRSIWGGLIVHLGIAWLMELLGGLLSSGGSVPV